MSALAARDVERLTALVDGFAGLRIVVLGDFVADEFVYGDIARVSREAPVLILDHRRTVVVPGGGANSVANLRALDARPVPVGAVGADESGRELLACLRRSGVTTKTIARVRGHATPAKSRVLAGGVHTRRQQVVRIDRGASRGELAPATLRAIQSTLDSALERADGLLVADYGFGSATPEVLGARAARLIERGRPVTVDSRSRVDAFRGVTACTPNQEELEIAAGFALTDDARVVEGGRKLLRRTGNRHVLVTRGARGMVLFSSRRRPVSIPAHGSDEVADVTGAGDTVIAAFTLGLAAGGSPEDAARLANYAAGIVVTKAGTATVSREELTAAIREDTTP